MERPRLLTSLGSLALGTGLGLGLMFLLDPLSGRRRRAALRDRLRRAGAAGAGAVAQRGRGLAQGSRELAAALRAQTSETSAVWLRERVRAQLARVASDPGAIEVEAEEGVVRLTGTVPLDELEDVVTQVASVVGVREVHNLLRAELPPPRVPGEH
jgi:osmotically-inducible protein OsmY